MSEEQDSKRPLGQKMGEIIEKDDNGRETGRRELHKQYSVQDAHKDLKDRMGRHRRDEDARQQVDEMENADKERNRHQAEQKRAAEWNDNEQKAARLYDQVRQNLQADAQKFQSIVQQVNSGQVQLTPQLQAKLNEAEQRLVQGKQQLDNDAKLLQRRAEEKQAAAHRTKFEQQNPGLKDDKKEFKKWLRDQGISQDRIDHETDMDLVGQYYSKFKETKKERQAVQRGDRIEAEMRKHSRTSMDAPRSSDDARAKLRRTGSMQDAKNWIRARRMEEEG